MQNDRSDFGGPEDVNHADAFARRLAETEHDGQLAHALAASVSEVGTTRAWELATVVRAAMREAVHLTTLERQLADRAPLVAGRLRMLGDVATLCLAEVIRAATREMTATHRAGAEGVTS